MTAPMPETMSPREKVAPSLNDLLRQAVETMKSWTPEQREAHFEAQKKAWVAAEMAFGDEGTRVVTSSSAALASSGDHAELARLAEAAEKVPTDWECDTKEGQAFIAAANPATVLALIAEVAALRAQHEADMAEVVRAGQNLQSQRIALTEAERKLAEADALLIELAAAPQPKATGGRFFRAMSSINAYVARLNASKEAERG